MTAQATPDCHRTAGVCAAIRQLMLGVFAQDFGEVGTGDVVSAVSPSRTLDQVQPVESSQAGIHRKRPRPAPLLALCGTHQGRALYINVNLGGMQQGVVDQAMVYGVLQAGPLVRIQFPR